MKREIKKRQRNEAGCPKSKRLKLSLIALNKTQVRILSVKKRESLDTLWSLHSLKINQAKNTK
jgi:hypothetical protein